MKIRKKITIYHGHNRIEPAWINSCKQDALSVQSRDIFNASTHNNDKRTTASKAVEETINCVICTHYDYYYGECMNDDKCTRVKFRLWLTHKAATQTYMNHGLSRNFAEQF